MLCGMGGRPGLVSSTHKQPWLVHAGTATRKLTFILGPIYALTGTRLPRRVQQCKLQVYQTTCLPHVLQVAGMETNTPRPGTPCLVYRLSSRPGFELSSS